MKHLHSLALTLLATSLSTSALYADVRFGGEVGYKFERGALEVHAARVINKSPEAGSSSLQIQVFATSSRHFAPEQPRMVLGTVPLNPLYAGHEYQELSKWTAYRAPQYSGSYYLTVALLEYSPAGYVIVDYVTTAEKVELAGTLPAPAMADVQVASPRCEPVCVTVPAVCETAAPVMVRPTVRSYRAGGDGVPVR
jgi:hypothetical protein